MALSLNGSLDLSSLKVREFLCDPLAKEYYAEPKLPPGFAGIPLETRPGDNGTQPTECSVVVDEYYKTFVNDKEVGLNKVKVNYGVGVVISLSYRLYTKDLNEDQNRYCSKLFLSYDPLKDGLDIESWVDANLRPDIDKKNVALSVCSILSKLTELYEIDASQRHALFTMYGQPQNGSHAKGEIPVLDYTLAEWARRHTVRFELDHIQPTDVPPVAPNSDVVREVPKGQANDPSAIQSILDEIAKRVVPGNCGDMKTEKILIVELPWFPDITVTWEPRYIKIGCSTITVYFPVVTVTPTRLCFYAYFSVPIAIDRFIFEVCEVCLKRAALESAVLAIITTQIELAVPTFSELFMNCVRNEITECINPGLLSVVERG